MSSLVSPFNRLSLLSRISALAVNGHQALKTGHTINPSQNAHHPPPSPPSPLVARTLLRELGGPRAAREAAQAALAAQPQVALLKVPPRQRLARREAQGGQRLALRRGEGQGRQQRQVDHLSHRAGPGSGDIGRSGLAVPGEDRPSCIIFQRGRPGEVLGHLPFAWDLVSRGLLAGKTRGDSVRGALPWTTRFQVVFHVWT